MDFHCSLLVQMQRKVQKAAKVWQLWGQPSNNMQRDTNNCILQNVLLCCIVLELAEIIILVRVKLPDRTANSYWYFWYFGDPSENFDKEGHNVFPDFWQVSATEALTESINLSNFPGRPHPDKNLSGYAYYGGDYCKGNHSSSWLSSLLLFLLTRLITWVFPFVLNFLSCNCVSPSFIFLTYHLIPFFFFSLPFLPCFLARSIYVVIFCGNAWMLQSTGCCISQIYKIVV